MRGPYGHRTVPARKSSMFFISYGVRAGPARVPYGSLRTRKGIDTTRIGKTPARASYLAVQGPFRSLTGPAGAVRGLFTISKPVRGPLAYNACIKTLRAPYGQAKFVRCRTGPVSGRMIFVQNSQGTAREQPLRGPGV